MRKNSKRVFAWLLTLSMVFTMLPNAAFAADAHTVTISYADGAYSVSCDNGNAGGDCETHTGTVTDNTYAADGENVTVASVDPDNALTIGGTAANVIVGADCTISATVSGTLTVNTDVTVTAGSTTYTAKAIDGDAEMVVTGHHAVLSGKVELTSSHEGHSWYVEEGATATLNGVTVTGVGTGAQATELNYAAGGATINHDVDTLSATNGTFTVNGNVTGSLEVGSSNVTVNGSVGASTKESAEPVISCGNVSPGGTVKVTGSVYGKIVNQGAYDGTVFKVQIGDQVDLSLVDVPDTETFAAYDTASNTLWVNGGSNKNIVKHNGTAAVPYNVIIENGVFNSNGQAIEGTVTFDNAKAADGPESADMSTVPTVTDGETDNAQGKVDYIPDGTEATLIKHLVFTENAAGYVNGQMGWTNKLSDISVGKKAYAAFSYANLDWQEGYPLFSIGDEAVINLTATRKNTARAYGILNDSIVSKLNSSEKGKYSFGNKITFLMGADAELANDITLPEGATATLHFYTDGDSTDKGITVSDNANLYVIGASKEHKLTLGGAVDTKVGKNALLNLKYVNHDRTSPHEDMQTQDTSKVYLNASTYSGTKNGNIETGDKQNPDLGVPDSWTVFYEEKTLTKDIGEIRGEAEIKKDADDPNKVTVTYTSMTRTVTDNDPNVGDKSITLTEETRVFEIADFKPDTSVTVLDSGNVQYTDKNNYTRTISPTHASSAKVGYILFGADGYGKVEVAEGWRVIMERVKPVTTFGGAVLRAPAATQEIDALCKSDTVEITIAKLNKGEEPIVFKNIGDVTDLAVGLQDATYKANFIVRKGDTMTVTMHHGAIIGGESTFDIAEGGTLKIVGMEDNEIHAPITLTHNNSTVELDGVKLTCEDDKENQTENDARVKVSAGVKGAKLVISGSTTILGVDGADNDTTTTTIPENSAKNPSHNQSAGIYNAGDLTVDVVEGKTLTVNGGTAKVGEVGQSKRYYGGAGIYNTADATLTFTGAGVANITGGTGGVGSTWSKASNDQNGSNGIKGGDGGAGIYNAGEVIDAMTSETWKQGQLVVTGGKGGVGGQGQEAGHVTASLTCTPVYGPDGSTLTGYSHDAKSTIGGTGGAGGDSGTGILGSGKLTVNSGVFLSYSGTVGDGGSAGEGDGTVADNCGGKSALYGSTHSGPGNVGGKGTDSKFAIDGAKLTVNGGTTYAFSGELKGGKLASLTVTGGTLWGSQKNMTGFDTASSIGTDMVTSVSSSGFDVSSATNDDTTQVFFTRIKTGTEGAKYLVTDMDVSLENNGGEYDYGGANTGMYANEQGYLYVWLPDITQVQGTYQPASATLTLKQDDKDIWYHLTCGGNPDTASTGDLYKTLYGYGDINGGAIAKSVITYDGKAAWGEEFELNGEKHYNGVDTKWLDSIIDWPGADYGWQDKGFKAPFGGGTPNGGNPDSIVLSTPVHMASVAWAIANDYRTHGKDFARGLYWVKAGTVIELSQYVWKTPIGTEKILFTGKMYSEGGGLYTVKGIRMPADYTSPVYGLFGYTDGATIDQLTVDGSDVAGKEYKKTLPTASYGESGLSPTSGGQYAWTADDMKWNGAVDAMGAIVGDAKNTTVSHCAVQNMSLTSATDKDVFVGGMVGRMNGGSIVGSTSSDAYKVDQSVIKATSSNGTSYAGGVVGFLTGGDVRAIKLVSSDAQRVTVDSGAVNKPTYAGGVAGYAKNATIADFISGYNSHTIVRAYNGSSIYAGGISGASENTVFDNNVVGDNGIAVSAIYSVTTPPPTYAGGVTASSKNDVIRDTSVVSPGHGKTLITATNGNAGGFAATSDGSKFYRSFVRSVSFTNSRSYVSMIQTATNTEMYGCYAQGVREDSEAYFYAFDTINGGKYVGCYTTAPGGNTGKFAQTDNSGAYFNCYAPGSGTEVKETDGLVGLTAAKLKVDALGAMNDELMKAEGTEKTNDSGFDWAAQYGAPIAYVTDTTPVNGNYPIHGVPHLVELKVVEGAGYGTARLDTDSNVIAVSQGDNYSSYWVMDGTTPTLNAKALVALAATGNASYGIDAEPTTAITMNGTAAGSICTVSLSSITADTVVNLKFVPETFTFYTLDLKSSAGTDSYSNTSRTSVKLDASEVNRYVSKGTELTKNNYTDESLRDLKNDENAIQTVVLSVDNGATLSVPAAPEGWALDAKSTSGYYHYNITAPGATAADVQSFLRGVSVTPANAEAKYRVSAFLYESKVDFIDSNYGGHFYQYVPVNVTWAAAYKNAADFVTTLGKADSYLAAITSAEENNYLFGTLHAYSAWMAAVRTGVTTGVADVDSTLLKNKPDGWYWVTGPEAGTQFMTAITGSNNKTAGQYSNWRSGEPNNAGGEWAAVFAYGGRNDWNDYAGTNRYGYIIEYQAGQNVMGPNFANDYYDYTKTPSGGGSGGHGGGNGGGSNTKPVDPDKTGVSSSLNTKDHTAYLHGHTNGSFGPDSNMTRGEVAQMFYNLLNDKSVSGSKSFSDVPADAWYHDAVVTLANLNIVQGVGLGKYDPERSVTRAEFTVIAMRFADELTEGTKTFSDVPGTHWAYKYIMAATGYGWINGYADGTFKPDGTITRAEVTTIVNHMLGRSADKAYVDAHAEQLKLFPDAQSGHWAYYDIVEATNAHAYAKTNGEESWKD